MLNPPQCIPSFYTAPDLLLCSHWTHSRGQDRPKPLSLGAATLGGGARQ